VAKDLAPDFCAPKNKDPYDSDGHYTQQACTLLTSLQSAPDLRTLLQEIGQFNSLALDYTNSEIVQLNQQIAEKNDPQTEKGYQYDLSVARQEEALLQRIGEELTQALAKNGSEVFDLHIDDLELSGYGTIVKLEVYLDKGEVRTQLTFVSDKIKDIDSYMQLKPIAQAYLIGLQNGDPHSTQDVKDLAKLMLGFVQSFVEPGEK
jgi:hypothetical protein